MMTLPVTDRGVEEEDACSFALYSKHAGSVTRLLCTESDIVNPVLAYRFDYLKNKTGRIRHCRIPFVSTRGASYMPLNFFSPHHGYLSDHTGRA